MNQRQAQSIHDKPSDDEVIALHCSGGNTAQWRTLKLALGPKITLHTPEHFGVSPDRSWSDNEPLSLAAEAEQTLNLIDNSQSAIHLVGHSYGGALALHIALRRPMRIASVSLYEPCAFHLFSQLGESAATARIEISAIATYVCDQINAGNYRSAMAEFVDYWNGDGAWNAMQPEHRNYLVQWAPNANFAFDALINEDTKLGAYEILHTPVYLLQGQDSPLSVHTVSDALLSLLPNCRKHTLEGLGHMGPLTHRAKVASLITQHVYSQAMTTVLPSCESELVDQDYMAA